MLEITEFGFTKSSLFSILLREDKMLTITILFVALISDKNYLTVSCSQSNMNSLQKSSVYTEIQDQEIYCHEYHKRVRYRLECATMCLKYKLPASGNDEFLNSQGTCTLFAFNETSTSGTNCMLCLVFNIEEAYQANTSRIIADYVFLTSNPATGNLFCKPIKSEF